MMDMAIWGDYLRLLDKLGDTLEQLTEIERTKTAAVGRGDLKGVEECMKREQVVSLSLRGTDQKREKLLAQLGLSGVPLRELEERGTPQPFAEVLRDIEERDFRDTHRQAAPLRQAEDAALLDTSMLNFQQSLETLLDIIRERIGV